jgi:hypothetical protein
LPQDISLRNYKIPQEIEILMFFKILLFLKLYVEEAPKHVFTVQVFDTTIFYMPTTYSAGKGCEGLPCFMDATFLLIGKEDCKV